MNVTVFIDGGAGTTGLEIRERLSGRDDVTLVTLDEGARKNSKARKQALNDADFVILCLPDDAAREAVEMIASDRPRVIDASTAHRVADGWTYGFPELEPSQQAAIADARFVSNPGCYPTGFLALVRPLRFSAGPRAGCRERHGCIEILAQMGNLAARRATVQRDPSGGASRSGS